MVNTINSVINILDSYPKQQTYKIKTNEAGDDYIIIPVPGFNKDNIEIKQKGKYIEIWGEYGSRYFNKTILLNRKAEDIQGKVKDGLLTLTFKNKLCNKQKRAQQQLSQHRLNAVRSSSDMCFHDTL